MFKKSSNEYKVIKTVAKGKLPVYNQGKLDLLKSVFKYYEDDSGKSIKRLQKKKEKLAAKRFGLLETLKTELKKELDEIKDDRLHVIHVDNKYRDILNEITPYKFIKNAKVEVVDVNPNVLIYDDVILIGIQHYKEILE